MVDGALLAVIGTLAGSLVTGGLSVYNTKIREKEVSKRRYGEAFLEKKVERLVKLHDSFMKTSSVAHSLEIDKYDTDIVPVSASDKELEEELQKSIKHCYQASIFLDDKQNRILEKGMAGLILLRSEYKSKDEIDPDRELSGVEEQANEDIEKTLEMLREAINEPSKFN